MDEEILINARLECLRIAVEFGTQRDVEHPHRLADEYWQWVRGSDESRPTDSRKDDSPKQAEKVRGVRKGSAPQK